MSWAFKERNKEQLDHNHFRNGTKNVELRLVLPSVTLRYHPGLCYPCDQLPRHGHDQLGCVIPAPISGCSVLSLFGGRILKENVLFCIGFGKIPWRMKWQPTPIFLPGKPQGQQSLAACLWGLKRVGQDWATKQQHGKLTIYHWMNMSPSCIGCGLLALGSGAHPKAHQLWHGPTWKLILRKRKFDREKNTEAYSYLQLQKGQQKQ